MKAFRIYDALDMRLEQLPTPEIDPNEVLIKVKAVGICTTDIELYDGSMPYFKLGLSERPMTPGHEWSGYVEKVGAKVTHLKEGDLVVGDISIGCGKCTNCLKGLYHLCSNRTELGVIKNDGAFAAYLKSDGKNVYKVPEGVTFEEAALIEPLATVLYAVRKTQIDPGQSVVVFGDGPIGLLNAQVANVSGAGRVAVVARKDMHKALIESWGITLIDTSKETLQEGLDRFCGGEADIVFEDTGNAKVLADAIRTVTPGGKLCVVSITGAPTIPVDVDYFVTRDVTIIGVLASPNSFLPALELVQTKKVDVKSCISHRFQFDDTVEAFEFVRNSSGSGRLKVLVVSE